MTSTMNRTTTTPQRYRVAPLDRQWTHAGSTVCLLGPLRGLDRASVVDAIRTLAAAGTRTRIGLLADADGKHWSYDAHEMAERAERMVTVEPPASAATADALARRLGAAAFSGGSDVSGTRSLVRVVLAGEWFALVMRHAVGDGFISMRLTSAIVSMAQGGPLPDWTELQPTARPLTTALVRTFARHPGNVVAVLRERAAPAHRLTATGNGEPGPGPMTDWMPAPEVVSARTSTAGRRDLHAWRRDHAPDASMAAVTLSLLRRGLLLAGLELDPINLVAMNARRYLPRTAVVHGNFAGRFSLSGVSGSAAGACADGAADGADDPVALSAAMDAAMATGRPLATIVASVIGARLARGAAEPSVAAVRTHAPTQVGYSFFGRPMGIERLDWAAGPEEWRIVAGVEPAQPHEIGWCVFQVGGGLQLSASFHHSSYDRDVVRAALDRICADPVAIMEAHHG